MDWSRRLSSACILLTTLWVIFVAVDACIDWPAEWQDQTLWEYVEESAIFAFLPPVLVLSVFNLALWVGRACAGDILNVKETSSE